MTEAIGEKIVTVLTDVVAVVLSQAQTESYPYAVYEQTVQPILSKSEAIAYESDTTIRIYSKDFSEADTLLQSVKTAMTMSGPAYWSELNTEQKNCVEEVWCMELNYRIIQTS